MSIRSDAFLGYSVDIDNKMKTLEGNIRDALLYDEINKITPEDLRNLHELNIISYWSVNKTSTTDKIMIVYDGMSGEYTKLFYIIDYRPDVGIYEQGAIDFFESVKTYLNKIETPDNVKKMLSNAYRFIFKEELDTNEIHLEAFIHYT